MQKLNEEYNERIDRLKEKEILKQEIRKRIEILQTLREKI